MHCTFCKKLNFKQSCVAKALSADMPRVSRYVTGQETCDTLKDMSAKTLLLADNTSKL